MRPYLHLFNISYGPVEQLLDIINFFNVASSKSTLGNPSYFELSTNKSDFFINELGFLEYPKKFILFDRNGLFKVRVDVGL